MSLNSVMNVFNVHGMYYISWISNVTWKMSHMAVLCCVYILVFIGFIYFLFVKTVIIHCLCTWEQNLLSLWELSLFMLSFVYVFVIWSDHQVQ